MSEHLPPDPLDRLIRIHPPQGPAPGLSGRIMERIRTETIAPPLWQAVWIQRLAAGLGLALALYRVLGYLLSAWIAVEIAG